MVIEEKGIKGDVTEHASGVIRMKRILVGVILVLLLILDLGLYSIWPLSQKVTGSWEYKEGQMRLRSENDRWQLTIPNYQGIAGYTMCYQGRWQTRFSQIYEGTDISGSVELVSQEVNRDTIEPLFQDNELFKVMIDTPTKLVVTYTKKGISGMFGRQNIDSFFHFKLTGAPLCGKPVLYLNNPFFSEERLLFLKS
ncbi:hypothetical protein [uncultured Vagococcus sp.]|uniref:hypothetical protein n=1 Tax=uncultured Vagococcus sp. TaxID=189676 RepID=UPI0028D59670|nr:hypothetical protein [uncultured Vagococcus sp.]